GIKKGQKGSKVPKTLIFLVLLTPPTSPPTPTSTLFGIFTFLMLSPTNRSQHSENPMGNEHFTDFFVKLPKLPKVFAYIFTSYINYKVNTFHMCNYLSILFISVVLGIY
ncbi:unnamed protein product, partial [Meganyctiphanes norvegica]